MKNQEELQVIRVNNPKKVDVRAAPDHSYLRVEIDGVLVLEVTGMKGFTKTFGEWEGEEGPPLPLSGIVAVKLSPEQLEELYKRFGPL